MALKAQDIYVVLKLIADGKVRAPYAQLASELAMSVSEVHASVKRSQKSGLLHGREMNYLPNLTAVEEFLVHGLKYAFPAERGELTRGIATSYGAPPLRDEIAKGSEPIPVWPWAEGRQRGFAFAPLYKSAPQAAIRDCSLYELMTLADALRDSRVRDRKIAASSLHHLLRKSHEVSKS